MHRRMAALAGLSLLVLAAGCAGPAANKAVIVRQVEEVLNGGTVAVMDELMSPEVVIHDPPPGLRGDREGFKQLMRDHHAAFSDFHCTNQIMVAEGDIVANRWSWTGMHDKGPYMGIKPTGKRATMTGTSIHRFENGRIVEQWHSLDMLGLLQQLGAVPRQPKQP